MKLELEEFAEDAPSRLRSIQYRLARGTFTFARAKGVPIPKVDERGKKTGKFRPIVLAPVESRIVQRALLNVLLTIDTLKPYANTPYSFGGIRSEKNRHPRDGTKVRRGDSLSAVPAAIKAVLNSISDGNRYVASADIRSFFTRIPKQAVTSIIAQAVNDEEFVDFFKQAIDVELENLAELRGKALDFPIEDIGVAQGNSLSPLMGNIVLASFDQVMNDGDCRCVRYIDDFIILAPNERAANARLRKAIVLLKELNMELSPEKSSKGGQPIQQGFDFLGINISPGLIRPGVKAQAKFLTSLDRTFDTGRRALTGAKSGQPVPRAQTLLGTLKRVDGMVDGWGKHYWFCNDVAVFASIDQKISDKVRSFLGVYREVRETIDTNRRAQLLGISELALIEREPFAYPSVR